MGTPPSVPVRSTSVLTHSFVLDPDPPKTANSTSSREAPARLFYLWMRIMRIMRHAHILRRA